MSEELINLDSNVNFLFKIIKCVLLRVQVKLAIRGMIYLFRVFLIKMLVMKGRIVYRFKNLLWILILKKKIFLCVSDKK